MKQVIILRRDLNMTTGKCVAQGAHASLLAYKKAEKYSGLVEEWEKTGHTKIVLKVDSIGELYDLHLRMRSDYELKNLVVVVIDEGRTQLPPNTVTALAIGPYHDEVIDKYTAELKLYK